MTDFLRPPLTRNADGQERRVGFEIEYAGVDIDTSAAIVEQIAGGRLERTNPFHYDLLGTAFGDFVIEIDASILHEQAYEKYLTQVGIDLDNLDLRGPLEKLLRSLATMVVPHEIVTPPLPLSRMELIDDVRAELVAAKARGTTESVLYGFGVHINPELPATDTDTLLAFMRAYGLLYDWICKQSHIDWSRRIGPYIKPWPDDYLKLILEPDYKPTRSRLADDYVRYIPSRNHALDMLPVLTYLEGKRLLPRCKEPALIKPRPAFHYRLPNCLIGEPDWRIAHEWYYWVTIERLAADRSLLTKLMQAWRQHEASWLDHLLHSWPEIVDGHIPAP